MTKEEVSAIENYPKEISQYLQEQAIVFQQIASTIPDSLYLKIKGNPTVKEAWDALKADFEKRSRMITIELRKRLQDTRCTENGNLRTHFDTIRTMREELASLGTILGEQDFSATILGSLPKSYDQFLSAVTATASVLKKDLNPEDLMQTIIDKYDRRSTRSRVPKEKGGDVAFYAEGNNSQGGKGGKKANKDVECFNCHKKGHKKAECWAKGGGKEGQGPKSKSKKEKDESKKGKDEPKKELASTAEEDGVWMAMTSNSDDKNMADSELDDFTVSENKLFFFEDDSDDEGNVLDLTTQLK